MSRYGERPPDGVIIPMQLPEGRYGEKIEWPVEPLLSSPPAGMKKIKKMYINTDTNKLEVIYE